MALTGNWNGASRMLATAGNPAVWKAAKRRSVLREAHRLRGIMIQSFNQGGPPGKRWPRLTTMTQLINRVLGKGDRRPMMDSGDLRNSHSVVEASNDIVFVGVHRTAKGRKSKKKMVDIAMIQEHGAGPIYIPVTMKMRGFFYFLAKKSNGQIKPLNQNTIAIVVRIRPRPWIGPIWDKEQEQSGKNIVTGVVEGLGIPGLSAALR